MDQVFDNFYRAEDSPAHAAGKPDDTFLAVADSGDAVQGALNASPIVTAKAADAGDYIINIFCVYLFRIKDYFPPGKAGFGWAP